VRIHLGLKKLQHRRIDLWKIVTHAVCNPQHRLYAKTPAVPSDSTVEKRK
jgi:hypothetical protein